MPSKISHSAPLSSVQHNSSENKLQQGAKPTSFWDKWSKLSTGQKWGRGLAWIILPIGIAFHIKANYWQSRQPQVALPRPQKTIVKKSKDAIDGIPLSARLVFGNEARAFARTFFESDLNNPKVALVGQNNPKYSPDMTGLSEQYAKDAIRNPDHTLASHDGQSLVHITQKTPDKAKAFRDFFRGEFPESPKKADEWAVFASKFMHQVCGAPILGVSQKIAEYNVPCDHMSLSLTLAQGGDNALLDIRFQGMPNNISEEIDTKTSAVDNRLQLKLILGPPENIEVVSGYSSHKLSLNKPIIANKEARIRNTEDPLKQLEIGNPKEIISPGVGLSNGANNCFMNSALAAFRGLQLTPTENANVPRLLNYLDGKIRTHGEACALRNEIINNLEFPEEIKNSFANGSTRVMHDAEEAFRAILESSDMPRLQISETLFYTLEGNDASHSISTQETVLPLPIQGNDSSIQESLNRFFEPENISGYKPNDSEIPQEATKMATIEVAPEKLAIQIKRFEHIKHSSSDDKGITSRMVNLFQDATESKQILDKDGNTHNYQPKGIIVHLPGGDATNASSGHYVYYEKILGNQWREINDEKSTDFDITTDLSRHASIQKNCYLVTYEMHV